MRVTRAAIRAQAYDDGGMAIHEDSDAAQEQEAQESLQTERPALKEITDANASSTTDGHADANQPPAKKAKGRKKAKAVKKNGMEQIGDIHQQDCQQERPTQDTNATHQVRLPSPPTGSVECEQSDEHPSMHPAATPVTETAPENGIAEVAKETMQTPQKELLPATKTPRFDPALHIPAGSPLADAAEAKDDSFVDSIKSRSPSKLSRESAEPDSFIEAITSRSPARRISRIEDSVEAMDALEDAIEEISGSLPKLEHLEVESPVKARKQSPGKSGPSPVRRQSPAKATTPAVRKTALDTTLATKTPKSVRVPPTKAKTAQLKPGPPRTISGRLSTVKPTATAPIINKSASRSTSIMPKGVPKMPSDSESQPQMSFSSSPTKQQPNIMKKRVTSGPLSTSKPAFVPAKSSKAPTMSNFILPGEAVAAKFKAQREERAKKAEEEKAKAKATFKARPAPPKISRPSVAPRETKASQARTSAIRTGSNKENVAPRSVPSTVSKPNTNLSVTKTRPDMNKPNSSVRRTTIPPKPATAALRASLAPRIASQNAGEKLAVTKEDAAQQKIKGKEVFGRVKAEKEAAEKEKREKEEAAKKARAEAAERGRQASREWAEKQKRKAETQKAAKAAMGGGLTSAAPGPATPVLASQVATVS